MHAATGDKHSVGLAVICGRLAMMGRLERDQAQLFYAFDLNASVPADHQVRAIDRVLDLSWVRRDLAAYPSYAVRPSIPAMQ